MKSVHINTPDAIDLSMKNGGRKKRKGRSSRGSSHAENVYSRSRQNAASNKKQAASAKCITNSKVPLREHQKRVVKYMQKNNGLLVVHGTGTGKTLEAATLSQCYLAANPTHKVIFVGPASLLQNFKKGLTQYGVTSLKNYEFYSYDKFASMGKNNKLTDCNKNLLIMDEAHNLRSIESQKFKAVMKCASKADKRLVLTATPFINNFHDLIPLVNLVYGYSILGTNGQKKRGLTQYGISKQQSKKDLETLATLLDGKVDIYSQDDPDNFPSKHDHYIEIPMTEDYYERYKEVTSNNPDLQGGSDAVFSKPGAFMNGYRRAVNLLGADYFNAKLENIPKYVKKNKAVIYSNWIEFGVKPLSHVLHDNGITYEIFSGEQTEKEKAKIVEAFNRDEFQVLVITKSGGEGIDLKGVRVVVVLEPPWTDSALQQIIGRAVRYKSHSHLPKADRRVDVYYLITTLPKGVDENDENEARSGDVILYDFIRQKEQYTKDLLKALKPGSLK
jgi:superfamily II DNA or RNA helicase